MAIGDTQDDGLIRRGATFSRCDRYRYQLTRIWDTAVTAVTFIMLNPSTASHLVDDPTIRRCMQFARREKYGGMGVVNLYAWRATDPSELTEVFDPQGPENDEHLRNAIEYARFANTQIICAWGAHPLARDVGDVLVTRYGLEGVQFSCLGKTKDGYPRHPLYVPSNTLIEAYP